MHKLLFIVRGIFSRPAPILTPGQVAGIREIVLKYPHDKKYDVRTNITVADYIQKTYHVPNSVSNAQRLLHRMGLVLRRPTKIPSLSPNEDGIAESVKKKLVSAKNEPRRVLVYAIGFTSRNS